MSKSVKIEEAWRGPWGPTSIMSVPDDSAVQGSKSATGDRGDRPELYNNKRKNTFPVPTSMFNPTSTQSSPTKLSKYMSSNLLSPDLLMSCFVLSRIVWGEGVVMLSNQNITLRYHVLFSVCDQQAQHSVSYMLYFDAPDNVNERCGLFHS